jgi:predicted DNA-binding transcriptional regulator YafY
MAKVKRGFSKFRSKWWKLCEIERQIRRGRACTCASLARDLEVDPRTIRRDIAFMRDELGAPIEYDPIEQTYALTNHTWTMPNVYLSEAELVALAVATRSMAAVMPAPFTTPLETLLAKLLDALPEAQREEVRSLQGRVDFVPSPIASKGQEWVGPLVEAIRDERVVEMTYRPLSKGKETCRRLDPYHLRFYEGAWYLIGYDHQTKHFPVFNLARVRTLQITDDSYRRRDFSAAEYFRHAVGVTVGGPPRSVRVLLTGRAAKTAGERVWPIGFTYTPQGEGKGVLAGSVSKLDDLLAWIAAIGGDATILPDGLPEQRAR